MLGKDRPAQVEKDFQRVVGARRSGRRKLKRSGGERDVEREASRLEVGALEFASQRRRDLSRAWRLAVLIDRREDAAESRWIGPRNRQAGDYRMTGAGQSRRQRLCALAGSGGLNRAAHPAADGGKIES